MSKKKEPREIDQRPLEKREQCQLVDLRQTEETLRALLNALPGSAFLIDPDGIVLDANETVTQRFGLSSKEQLIGQNFYQFLPPEVAEGRKRYVEEVVHTRQPARFEDMRFNRFIDNSIVPVLDAHGNVTRLAVFGLDITEVKQTEQALSRLAERFDIAIRAANIGIWDWDLRTGKTVWNDNMFTIYGVRREDYPATHEAWTKLIHPDDLEQVERIHQQIIADERVSQDFEVRNVWPNGEIRHMLSYGQVILDEDERPLRLVGVNMDITPRKRVEEALAQKTAELERSNAELEQFAYIASHDLQEPLRMVTSYIQLIEESYRDQLDAEGQEFLHYAVDGATRMKTLINDLLQYSRVGRLGKELTPTDTEKVLRRVLTNLQIAIEENHATVTHDPLPEVMADDVQLEQVIQNLIGNAIKFHGNVYPVVHIRARREGNVWLFSVCDNGIGIDPRHYERIFLIFQRLHPREKYPGTGIGLAICKRVIERHGGKIWVESLPGKGSTFYFTIPMKGK